ncbi:MAG: succinyl-CoA--3-ketoacid-CoA transferase [Gracilibacteraceae bacterium]|jgi:3-oxoacid CoA-transferase B subunit|nr:succinyl-CoA--3-ketoacid-CoA transferase [Gracilibacteraceae bacterium]
MTQPAEVPARIARNAAALFNEVSDTFVMNLGVGIPTLVADYVTNENIFVMTENGMIGTGKSATPEEAHPQLINASRQLVRETPGCVYLDSAEAFGLIRSGRVDATVLGAFQVDQHGNIANWIIPGGKQLGVGGAMDLVAGAKQVVIAMTHANNGKSKLVRECSLPVTGFTEADIVVTEMGVFFYEDGHYILRKIAADATIEQIRQTTELEFLCAAKLETMLP